MAHKSVDPAGVAAIAAALTGPQRSVLLAMTDAPGPSPWPECTALAILRLAWLQDHDQPRGWRLSRLGRKVQTVLREAGAA